MATALITGASRGLGLALARALAERGWTLILDARGADALETARAELARQTQVVAIAGDVADAAHRAALAEAAQAQGGLDAVVNNASILGPSPQPNLLDYPLDVLENVYRANVIAPLGVLQAVRGSLKPGARIINVSSDAGVEAYPGWGGYGSSKAALEHLSAILAEENPDLKVYWVDPGDMRTQMQQAAFPGEDISDRPLPEESVPGFIELLTGERPQGRYQARALETILDAAEPGVNWLNLVLMVNDYAKAMNFMQEGLGLQIAEEWHEVGNGAMLEVGRATIEILDTQHVAEVDRVEVGKLKGDRVRLALGVGDLDFASERVQQAGAAAENVKVDTPWGHRNQRLAMPPDLPITALTLFQVMDEAEAVTP
ncbi:MAG: SDR family NAD(P)-dependent oxidoreductase [Anaerolineae bacterium]|nr:SDR family NAD(P)-dependent oxidoreductase [Anaerolineae bacterium]